MIYAQIFSYITLLVEISYRDFKVVVSLITNALNLNSV